jgi:hypothetical protein
MEQYIQLKELFSTTKEFEPEAIAKNFEQQMWSKVNLEIESIEKEDTSTQLESSLSILQRLKNAVSKWLL